MGEFSDLKVERWAARVGHKFGRRYYLESGGKRRTDSNEGNDVISSLLLKGCLGDSSEGGVGRTERKKRSREERRIKICTKAVVMGLEQSRRMVEL